MTLKTGVMAVENAALPSLKKNDILKYNRTQLYQMLIKFKNVQQICTKMQPWLA